MVGPIDNCDLGARMREMPAETQSTKSASKHKDLRVQISHLRDLSPRIAKASTDAVLRSYDAPVLMDRNLRGGTNRAKLKAAKFRLHWNPFGRGRGPYIFFQNFEKSALAKEWDGH